jgi:hypothetical protein
MTPDVKTKHRRLKPMATRGCANLTSVADISLLLRFTRVSPAVGLPLLAQSVFVLTGRLRTDSGRDHRTAALKYF